MPNFSVFAVTYTVAAASTIVLAAAEHTEDFVDVAERWGLWAALTLVLIGAAMWALYRMVLFTQTTMVHLIQENQRCLTKITAVIRAAPCGDMWDSDEDRPTEGDGEVERVRRAVERVRSRRAKGEK